MAWEHTVREVGVKAAETLENGPIRKRVGLFVEGRQPVREGAAVRDEIGVALVGLHVDPLAVLVEADHIAAFEDAARIDFRELAVGVPSENFLIAALGRAPGKTQLVLIVEEPARQPFRVLANEGALAAFVQTKVEIDAMLSRLQALSDEHFAVAPDEVTWGHVGSLGHDAELAIFAWIEGWYNPERIIAALGMRSPDEYEAAFYADTQNANPATPVRVGNHETSLQ